MELYDKTKRLPSFRLPSSTSSLSKKIVPNLNVSKELPVVQPKPSLPQPPNVSTRNDKNNIVNNKKRPAEEKNHTKHHKEKCITPGKEVFAPSVYTTGSFPLKFQIHGSSFNRTTRDQEKFDDSLPISDFKNMDIDSDSHYTDFDSIPFVSAKDKPVTIPRKLPLATNHKLENPLDTILSPNDGQIKPLLLKTPKYLPLTSDEAKNKDKKYCSIHDLPPGQIGELQKLKSGKWRLVIGECKFDLTDGIRSNIKEQLTMVKTDAATKSGQILTLCNIKDRVIAVPQILFE